jgi:nucleoside-diphosphate-sugar epimerase
VINATIERLRAVDRVVVLGANGWFGRTMVDLLEQSFGNDLAERTELYARGAHRLTSSEGRDLRVSPLSELGGLSAQPATLLVDCAYPTQEQVTALGAGAYVEVVAELREQRRTALEQLRPEAFVSLSSGAAKLFADGLPMAARTQVYGEMKWLDERQMLEDCPELGVRLCIARVYAASGPHMTKASSYALGDLIEQARAGDAIEIRAPHRVMRSYTLAADALEIAVLASLGAAPERPELFETGGEQVDLAELARRVSLVVRGEEPELLLAEPDGSADDVYLGDPARIVELADLHGLQLAGLDDQILRTAENG